MGRARVIPHSQRTPKTEDGGRAAGTRGTPTFSPAQTSSPGVSGKPWLTSGHSSFVNGLLLALTTVLALTVSAFSDDICDNILICSPAPYASVSLAYLREIPEIPLLPGNFLTISTKRTSRPLSSLSALASSSDLIWWFKNICLAMKLAYTPGLTLYVFNASLRHPATDSYNL